eukprot:scaffold4391_cov120-Isochrysis_galbana.AAC.4
MTPEDREPDAPDMSHADTHTHTSPRPYRRRAFRQGTLRHSDTRGRSWTNLVQNPDVAAGRGRTCCCRSIADVDRRP